MRQIRNSAKAVIIREQQLLVTKLLDEGGVFYLLPGGGQMAGEDLRSTLVRECHEETGFVVEVKELIGLRECFMDPQVHRVEFMFHCEILSETAVSRMDAGQVGLDWLELGRLEQEPLFPVELRTRIPAFARGVLQPVYMGEVE